MAKSSCFGLAITYPHGTLFLKCVAICYIRVSYFLNELSSVVHLGLDDLLSRGNLSLDEDP